MATTEQDATQKTAAAPKKVMGNPGMLFFGANRRSGTTWLHAMLNTHPEIVMRNEGWFLNDIGCSAEQWLDQSAFRVWAALGSSKGTWLAGTDTEEAVTIVQRAMVEALMRHSAAKDTWKDTSKLKWIGDKTTTHYTAKIDTLHRLFPEAKFLCMVRDGRDVVVSDHFMRLRDKDFNAYPGAGSEDARRAYAHYYQGDGPPCPFFTEETLGMLIAHWERSIKGGIRGQELYGSRSFLVRYEQLVAEPTRVADIFEFLEVTHHKGMVDWIVDTCRFERFAEGRKQGEVDLKSEYRKGIIGDWRNYFTERDKEQFKQSGAGQLLIDLGYEKDNSW